MMPRIIERPVSDYFDDLRDEFTRDVMVKEYQKVVGVSNSLVYDLLNSGDLEAYKIGRCTRIKQASANASRGRSYAA